jgi:hypothetical protein
VQMDVPDRRIDITAVCQKTLWAYRATKGDHSWLRAAEVAGHGHPPGGDDHPCAGPTTAIPMATRNCSPCRGRSRGAGSPPSLRHGRCRCCRRPKHQPGLCASAAGLERHAPHQAARRRARTVLQGQSHVRSSPTLQ